MLRFDMENESLHTLTVNRYNMIVGRLRRLASGNPTQFF